MKIHSGVSRQAFHQQRQSSISSRSPHGRLTSEERQILRTNQEKQQFEETKQKWSVFYQRTIIPSYEVPFQQQIKKQKNWVSTPLTEAKPFNFSLSNSQSLHHQSIGCGSSLNSMIFARDKFQLLQKASQSLVPRRSLSNHALNDQAMEKKQQLKIQSFEQKAHTRRSLSLGPDGRLLVDTMQGDMLPLENHGQQYLSKRRNDAVNEGNFQIHTSAYRRPKRKPLSIGASSYGSGPGQRFQARPMPNFEIISPRANVLFAEKDLTIAMPFDFETEKRSLSRLMTKPSKPVLIDDKGSAKENYVQAPMKRQATTVMQRDSKQSSKRKQWSPRRDESVGHILGELWPTFENQQSSQERITIAKSPMLETELRVERKFKLQNYEK